MIKTIRVFGFQSHASTVINLSPGVNYVIGPSDSGKSAVIRALRWLWINRPLGSTFVSSFSEKGECLVSVETDTFSIIRSQTKSKNVYQINDQEYKSFGQNPPQEVLDLLGWDIVNVQNQREQGFLLSDTPGKVSVYLNSLVGLDVVDSAVKKITSSIRALSAQEKAKKEQVIELEDRLASFPDLDLAEQWVEEADRLRQSIILSEKRSDGIIERAETANEQDDLICFNDSILRRIDYNNLVEAEENLKTLYNRFETLTYLGGLQEGALSTLTKEVPDEIDGSGLLAIKDRRRHLARLEALDKEQRTAAAHLKSFRNQIDEIDKEYNEKFPEVCPLCDQPILEKQKCQPASSPEKPWKKSPRLISSESLRTGTTKTEPRPLTWKTNGVPRGVSIGV